MAAKSLKDAEEAWRKNPGDADVAKDYALRIAMSHQLGALSEDEAKKRLKEVQEEAKRQLKAGGNGDFVATAEKVMAMLPADHGMPPEAVVALIRHLQQSGINPDEVELKIIVDNGATGGIIQALRKAAPDDGIGTPVGHA